MPDHADAALKLEGAVQARLDDLRARVVREPAEVAAELAPLLAGAREGGDLRLQEQVLELLGRCAFNQQDYLTLLRVSQEHLAALQHLSLPDQEVRALNGVGIASYSLGLHHEALEAFLAALKVGEHNQTALGRAQTLTNVANCHLRLGNHAQALELQLEALEIALSLEHPRVITSSYINLICIYVGLGQYHKALELGSPALLKAQQQGQPGWEMEIHRSLSRAYRSLGHLAEAQHEAEEGLKISLKPPRADLLMELRLELARVYLAKGDVEAATRQLQWAEQAASLPLHDNVHALDTLQSELHQVYINLYEQQGHFSQALRHSRLHLEAEQRRHARLLEIRSHSLLAHQQLRALQREAELERQRNAALEEKNLALLAAQTMLSYQATHDGLTGVVNRTHFLQRVQDALEARQPGEHAALLFIDLDQFKSVNDLYSHAIGDDLLRQVAARLRGAVQPPDVVGRVGGDEFNVLLLGVPDRQAVMQVAWRLLELLRQPYEVQGRPLEVTVSIGCAFAPEDGSEASILQGHADLAMYNIKHSLRNNVLMYSEEIKLEHERRLNLERDLRGALPRRELQLYYQGRFNVQKGDLVGFEALIRWFHPQLGLIMPNLFIPLAENSGQILDIGAWVLRRACQQAADWDFAGRDLTMSVNVSPLQFEQEGFVREVQAALSESGLPGHCLLLELTETLVLRDMERARTHIAQVQALGVRVAIDDFGSGFSSMSVLHDLSFDQLKIDQSFIHRIRDGSAPPATSSVLMEGMVNLAHDLTMEVTAEGLENVQQLRYLRDLQCDFAQGFLLGVPAPASEAEKLLGHPY